MKNCKHGNFPITCAICHYEDEINALRARVARLEEHAKCQTAENYLLADCMCLEYRECVTALSSVARLEEALREAKLQIEYLHGKFQETGSGNAVLARIDSALEEK